LTKLFLELNELVSKYIPDQTGDPILKFLYSNMKNIEDNKNQIEEKIKYIHSKYHN
jgi:hypothetical protein